MKSESKSTSAIPAMGRPRQLFTPVFAVSQTVGWTSQILEQWDDNRLIGPRAEYCGRKGQQYKSISERI
jgi:citrate synthase